MESAGSIQSIHFFPPPPNNGSWKKTTRTKIEVPAVIEVRWVDGRVCRIVPREIGNGRARDVLGGTLENTQLEWEFVLKVQDWGYHVQSNQHEYRLATGALRSVSPCMADWAKTVYQTAYKPTELSVLVVARVSKTMNLWLLDIFRGLANHGLVGLLLGIVEACIQLLVRIGRDTLLQICTYNTGVTDDDSVVLLDLGLKSVSSVEKDFGCGSTKSQT